MALKLVINDQLDLITNQEFDQSLITFGRSKSCHVELNNPDVSRRHFLIKFIDDTYMLIDEGSRHGTILDQQKIEPHTNYPLAKEHLITVPGFSIKLMSDGKKPKMDRTLVVARQLLDELLHDEAKPRACAQLRSHDGAYSFNFVEEKASFVLGSWPEVEFVVNAPHVVKKHLSFARDINGIRLIPLPGHLVMLNNEVATEAVILTHGAIIKVGDIELTYHEQGQGEIFKTLPAQPEQLAPEEKIDSPIPKERVAIPQPRPSVLWALDRLFFAAFILVLAGASFLLFEMM